jgi:hypothetical protein
MIFAAFSKAKQIMQKNTNAKLDRLSCFLVMGHNGTCRKIKIIVWIVLPNFSTQFKIFKKVCRLDPLYYIHDIAFKTLGKMKNLVETFTFN